MRLLLFWTMISTILLFAATGCEELDRIAQGVRDVNEAGTRFVQTPTGKAMPPDIRWILEAGGGLAAGFASKVSRRRRIRSSRSITSRRRSPKRCEMPGSSMPATRSWTSSR